MRFNVLGCFLVLAITALAVDAADLLGQPDHFYRLNGYAVVLALVMLLAWPPLAWRANSTASGAETQPPAPAT
jgi:hypothetical protein